MKNKLVLPVDLFWPFTKGYSLPNFYANPELEKLRLNLKKTPIVYIDEDRLSLSKLIEGKEHPNYTRLKQNNFKTPISPIVDKFKLLINKFNEK